MDPLQQIGLRDAIRNRLNHLTVRQAAISSNIANVNTPNYKAKEVTFQKVLSNSSLSVRQTNAKHLAPISAKNSGGIPTESKLNPKHNGNTVHIDEQMIKLNDLKLSYRLMTSLYSKHSAMQKMALGAGAAK